jgi:hypothetical protein
MTGRKLKPPDQGEAGPTSNSSLAGKQICLNSEHQSLTAKRESLQSVWVTIGLMEKWSMSNDMTIATAIAAMQ